MTVSRLIERLKELDKPDSEVEFDEYGISSVWYDEEEDIVQLGS